jgi:hypothetical protein
MCGLTLRLYHYDAQIFDRTVFQREYIGYCHEHLAFYHSGQGSSCSPREETSVAAADGLAQCIERLTKLSKKS